MSVCTQEDKNKLLHSYHFIFDSVINNITHVHILTEKETKIHSDIYIIIININRIGLTAYKVITERSTLKSVSLSAVGDSLSALHLNLH